MKFAQRLLLLAGALFACQFSVGLERTAAASANNEPVSTADAPVPSQSVRTKNTMLIRASSGGVSAGTSVAKTITISMPVETRPETIQVVLNGKDVTSQFSQTFCSAGICETGTLSSSNGLRAGKNVLYAISKKSDGTFASSRLRFAGDEIRAAISPAASSQSLAAQQTPAFPTASNFIPPAVAFTTLNPGGYNGANPWIRIGTQQTYPDNGYSCSSYYTVIVLDRQTLTEKTSAPESSPQCFQSGSSMAAYLGKLSSQDLVIVGSNFNYYPDSQLSTTAIGGTDFTKAFGSSYYPLGYMAIGAGGATPGSAYENYYMANGAIVDQFARGMLVEDVNGNYNFQSSGAIEYLVSPNDPANNDLSTVTLFKLGSLSQYSSFTYPDKVVFYSPANQTNGYWMIKLNRENLSFDTNCGAVANSAKQQTDVPACGTFYPTGSSDSATATSAYQALAGALKTAVPADLIFLVTVGQAGYSANQSPFDVANTSSGVVNAYYQLFGPALENLGGTPGTTLSLYKPGSAYSLVSCAGCGNSLTGHVALSSSVFAQQGETGFIHGIVQRNLNGYYWPHLTSQESQAQNVAGASADFTITLVSSQQPDEWPELSGIALPGATSVTGQVAAYHYLSYQSVTQYYVKSAQGNHLDDLHYYFTGSLNTMIDYHTFNPANISFPGAPNSCYVWTDPATGGALDCFTAQDLQAVGQQVSAEVVDLDNVLQYMVTGSTNMKDVVAAGQRQRCARFGWRGLDRQRQQPATTRFRSSDRQCLQPAE